MTSLSFKEILESFDSVPALLLDDERTALDEQGFLVIPPDLEYWRSRDVDPGALLTVIDTLVAEEGWRGGIEGKESSVTAEKPLDPGSDRIGNLLEKDLRFRYFISHPKVLAAVDHIIGAPFKCSAVDMRNPKLGGGEQQLHIDWLPRMDDRVTYDCVFAGFYLDGMKVESGALRVVPGTHRRLDWPNEYIDVLSRHPDEIRVEVEPGSIVVANALVWHGGATNISGVQRRSVYVDYRRREIGQLLNQKRYLSNSTIDRLTEMERYLLAVRREDPTDETLSLGPGAAYRARYGNHYIPTDSEHSNGQ
jgi:hypothetical protein